MKHLWATLIGCIFVFLALGSLFFFTQGTFLKGTTPVANFLTQTREDLNTFIRNTPAEVTAKDVRRNTISLHGYSLSVAMQSNATDPVTFTTPHGDISFASFNNQTLGKPNTADVTQTDNRTVYDNIYNGVSLIYTTYPDRVLEEYELKTKRPMTALIQKIDTGNVTYQQQSDGSIIFRNKQTGDFAFAIPRPVMYEAVNSENRNYDLHYEIKTINNQSYLVKVIDQKGQDWLQHQANYPVMIDATVSLNTPYLNPRP